jgi:hypothetical protein
VEKIAAKTATDHVLCLPVDVMLLLKQHVSQLTMAVITDFRKKQPEETLILNLQDRFAAVHMRSL